MLLIDNFTSEHIYELRKNTGADPSILERTIFAFGLLEAITKVGLPFIFKGGTSLMLLLDTPRRLSTDIDIIVAKGVDVDQYINEAGKIFPFISVEENVRKDAKDIEKRHFKFLFLSPRTNKEINVLLDIVFENNPYHKITEKEISNNLLLDDGNNLKVQLPDINCILADKLTAFAPKTIGIPFGKDKELEIIKQMYDCWTLLQEMTDYKTVAKSYEELSVIELGYRSLDKSPADCLLDTIESCLCIIGRGGIRADDYQLFYKGINAIQGHILTGRINGENAGIYASEIMYLATCLLTKSEEYIPVIDSEQYIDAPLEIKGAKTIKNIRKVNPIAYAYVVKSIHLLQEAGLYKE